MSLLDELNGRVITEEWLLKNKWIPCTDYSGDPVDGWYNININVLLLGPESNRPAKICVGYKLGANLLSLWNKFSTVTTVEELDFAINQICKQERIKYLGPKWMD